MPKSLKEEVHSFKGTHYSDLLYVTELRLKELIKAHPERKEEYLVMAGLLMAIDDLYM